MSSVCLLDQLHWLGHASFRLDGPPIVYLDPWQLEGSLPEADLVLVSHEHYDHCSPEDVVKISGPETVVIANPTAARKLTGDVRVLRSGERTSVKGIEVEAVPAYNVGKSFHPKRAGHVGYILTVGGGRLYFAGDTDRIPEMRDVRCDVALLPVGGTYTMNAEEAAWAAADIGPKTAVPMHYGGGGIGTAEDGERFRRLYLGNGVILKNE